MNRKIATLLLAAIIIILAVASEVLAQSTYRVVNNSMVTITASVEVICPGPPPFILTTPTFVVPPGQSIVIAVPLCPKSGVIVNGVFYPVGYNGPIVPPNPPTWIQVTPTGVIIW